jgi:hypothetical protein
MAQKKNTGREQENILRRTRMRSPFTAEVPNEFKNAEWIPDLTSLPDVSNDEGPARDPLAFVPGSEGRSTGD